MSLDVLTISYHEPDSPVLFENSLKHTGIAVIKDYPILPTLIDSVYEEWKLFFAGKKIQLSI